MPTDKAQKPISKNRQKIREGTEKLFSGLEDLVAAQEPAEYNKQQRRKESKKTTAPQETIQKNLETEALRARIIELEKHLQGSKKSTSAIYEKEKVGYVYKGDALEPLSKDGVDESPKDINTIQAPLIDTGQTIGSMYIEASPEQEWNPEEENLVSTVAQQVSLQIQSLRLLASAERARIAAEEATRSFMHEGWASYLDAIYQNERIGYAYDQASVTPFLDTPDNESTYQETVNVMDEQVGTLSLKNDPSRPITDDDKKMVASVASQIAQQVENIRLLADASRSRAEAEEATRRLTHKSWQDFATHSEENALGFVYDTVQVSPLGNSPLPQNISLTVPLEVRGEKIGQLAATGDDTPTAEAIELATAIAAQTNVHIENLRLLDETERSRQQLDKRAAELETVAKVSTAAAAIRDPESLLRSVVDLTNYSFKLYHTSVYLVDENKEGKQILRLAAASGKMGHKMLADGHFVRFKEDQPIFKQVTRAHDVYISSDIKGESVFLARTYLPNTRSEMVVPMIVADQFIGIFDVKSEISNRFTEDDISTYTTLASQTAVALQNAQLYEEQIATVERLRELDHLKSSFLANMSHELRTPLNSISGFTQVMLEGLDGPLTNEMQEDLGLIDKNADHLLRLINEVLDMAKIEAGNIMVVLGPSNIHNMLEEVIKTTSALAHKNKLSLSLENNIPKDLIVIADDMRIQQVMINLIGNAMKFAPEGGVTIYSEVDEDIIRIKVSDTGIGIPPELLESIFEAFSQVDTTTTRKVGGTGLGLPISKRFIGMHNGRLWAESTGIAGEGSVFTIEIPIVMPDEETEEE